MSSLAPNVRANAHFHEQPIWDLTVRVMRGGLSVDTSPKAADIGPDPAPDSLQGSSCSLFTAAQSPHSFVATHVSGGTTNFWILISWFRVLAALVASCDDPDQVVCYRDS